MENIGGNVLLIKEININLIRETLMNIGQATKSQIAKTTGLSNVTVGTMLQILLENNEINEIKLIQSSGGRPAQEYSYNFNHKYSLIIFPFEKEKKIFINSCVSNLAGEVIFEDIIETEEVNLLKLEQIVEKTFKLYPNIKALSFGNPGVENKGTIVFSDYKSLEGISFEESFKSYGVPIIVENDVNAAVIGFGKRKKLSANNSTVYIYFPDNYPPGSGILVNGKIYKGYQNYAGEISMLPQFLWSEKIYESFDEFCKITSETIITLSCILNPKFIILNGTFIKNEHVELIKELCKVKLSEKLVPKIFLSENFLIDYKEGLIENALELLTPDISLTRKRK